MKKKFSKILGVGLTLALLTSLLLTAAPVSADVSSSSVSVTNLDISDDASYTLIFQITTALNAATPDEILVEFPAGFDVSSATTDVEVAATSGIGTTAFALTAATTTIDGTNAQLLRIDVPNASSDALDDIGVGATVQVVIGDAITPAGEVTNAAALGTYELLVSTTVETTEVTSASFTLVAPTIPDLPGIVEGFNSAGVPLFRETGNTAIDDAIGTAGVATIDVGPGTYTGAVLADIADQVIKSTDGALVTIITTTVTITEAVTLDGFTVEGTLTANSATEPTIQNCVMNAATGAVITQAATFDSCTFDVATTETGVDVNGAGGTITGSTFNVAGTGIGVDIGAGVTVDSSMFNGASGIGIDATATATATISGNIFDGLDTAITVSVGTPILTIEGNVISNSVAAAIDIAGTDPVVTIIGNTISDNADDILLVDAAADGDNIFMNFNTITGNTKSVDNDDTNEVDATNNWWGDVAGPAVASEGLVDTSPWLVMAASNPEIAIGGTTLDAEATAGVSVTTTAAADAIAVATYATNPGTAAVPGVASAYYDVSVSGTPGNTTIMLYGSIGADTLAYVWGAGLGEWVECDTQSVNVFAGSITVSVQAATIPTITDLAGLPFAIADPPSAAATLGNPTIITPDGGAADVRLTPTFAWEPVDDAAGYYFELADNATFVVPLAKLDGDLGRLIVTAYAHVTALDYSTAYYWRVKAVSGTIDGGNLVESAWVSSVFITADEPVEPVPPIVIEPTPPAPTPIIEPIVEVIIPPATPMTPAWIYVIIGVGAVLVIALIVLVVRTRRVA